jgi:hemolysin III
MQSTRLSPPAQSHSEEIWNAITHGVGALLSLAALAFLVVASSGGSTYTAVASAIYGTTLVLLYAVSTLYHSFRRPRLKRLFQVLDHCCIYLLIAGTYTPYTLTVLRGPVGWTLFAFVWGAAAIGITFKVFFTGRFDGFSTLAYLVMGWAGMLAIKPLLEAVPLQAFLWFLAGGFFYTAGCYFYRRDHRRYYHTIWHCFVLAGSICQFAGIMFSILPR